MLPLTTKKPLHVPHGLALLAAVVCLTLAIFSDVNERQERLLTMQAEAASNQRSAATARESDRDRHSAGEAVRTEVTRTGQPTQWFPWFPGLPPGGR